jgi:hypothetical protein
MIIIKKLIPHICIILTLVTLTLFILVQFNPSIIASDFFSIMLYLFCGFSLAASGLLIAYNRRS